MSIERYFILKLLSAQINISFSSNPIICFMYAVYGVSLFWGYSWASSVFSCVAAYITRHPYPTTPFPVHSTLGPFVAIWSVLRIKLLNKPRMKKDLNLLRQDAVFVSNSINRHGVIFQNTAIKRSPPYNMTWRQRNGVEVYLHYFFNLSLSQSSSQITVRSSDVAS